LANPRGHNPNGKPSLVRRIAQINKNRASYEAPRKGGQGTRLAIRETSRVTFVVKKFNVKMPEERKTPPSYPNPPESVVAAGIAVGRAALEKLSSATLYKLLQLKNMPGRSKARSRAGRVKSLENLVTSEDLKVVGVPAPADCATGASQEESPLARAGESATWPGPGVRLEEPVGSVDVHSVVLVAAVVSAQGAVTRRELTNTLSGGRDLAALFKNQGVRFVAMESTAEYWLKPFWVLSEAGLHVIVANPVQTKATQGSKTDWKDALRLAYALRDGRLKPSVTCTPEQYARKKLNRDAIKKVQQGAKALSRMNAMFHTFDAPEWVGDLYSSQRGLRVLSRCLALAREEEVGEVLETEYAAGKGKVTDPAKLGQMAAELASFLGRLGACPENRVRFGHHLEEHVTCHRMAAELRAQVLKHAATDARFKEDLELLVSLPDVGVDLALTIAVELVDVQFFTRAKGLSKWAGLAPRVSQSGFKKRVTGHIFKGGNKWLRSACWMVAKVAYAHSGNEGHPFGDFVSRLYNGGKKAYKVAVTAGARRVLTFAFHVLVQRRPFAEVWAELASEEVEANRVRKVKELEKRVKQASVSDLLPVVAASLRRSCSELEKADAAYAEEISNILGSAFHVASAE
jgi:transposase